MATTPDTSFLTDPRRPCAGRADLFAHVALDYHRDGEDYAGYTQTQHEQAAAAKAAVEAEAIDKCLDCPLMVACLNWALTEDVAGVVGGETEDARREMRAAAVQDEQDEQVAENARGNTAPAVCPSDRGVRGQIDDATVALMTRAGKTSEEIAHDMGCSVRSITRARGRIAKAAEAAAAEAKTVAAAAVRTSRALPATRQPLCTAQTPTVTTVTGPDPRRLSSFMAAIYDVLADGQWHHQNDLVAAGTRHVTDAEAIAWWTKRYAKQIAANPALPQSTPDADKIAYGARDKVLNSLSASARNRGRTTRGGATGTDPAMFRTTTATLASAGA